MANIALQVEKLADTEILNDQRVEFDNLVIQNGNISFDNMTGVITFNEPGRYTINWFVAVQSASNNKFPIFEIETTPATEVIAGNSPIKTSEVSGFAIIDVPAAGTVLE